MPTVGSRADLRATATAVVIAALLAVVVASCGRSTTTGPGADATGTAEPAAPDAGDVTPLAPSSSGVPRAAGADTGDRSPVDVTTLTGSTCPDDTVEADFPDVVGARFTPVDGTPRTWRVEVTLCSRYDAPRRHADAWRVVSPEGDVLGTRELLHDHAAEQPFTRSLTDELTVPDGVDTVVVEARDRLNGWGGTTLEVDLTQ